MAAERVFSRSASGTGCSAKTTMTATLAPSGSSGEVTSRRWPGRMVVSKRTVLCMAITSFGHYKHRTASRARYFAGAVQPGAVADLAEQKVGFAQDAAVALPAQRFGGIVEGVVLAVGEG